MTDSLLATDQTVRITEIFVSLQGESSYVGLPTVFVRLTGCPLRCVYCDTAYSFHGGESIALDTLLTRIASLNTLNVCITGGEPLAQKSCLALLQALCERGYTVSLETSGAMDISAVDVRVKRIVDLKTPSSGELEKNQYDNINCLTAQDEVKFVICDRDDYVWAVQQIEAFGLYNKVENILFSPVFAVEKAPAGSYCRGDDFNEQQLAQWILDDGLAVRMQLQLHKLIWGNQPGK